MCVFDVVFIAEKGNDDGSNEEKDEAVGGYSRALKGNKTNETLTDEERLFLSSIANSDNNSSSKGGCIVC